MKTYTYTANNTAPNSLLRDVDFLATNLVNEINYYITENEIPDNICETIACHACAKAIATILYQTHGYDKSFDMLSVTTEAIKSKLNHLEDLKYQIKR